MPKRSYLIGEKVGGKLGLVYSSVCQCFASLRMAPMPESLYFAAGGNNSGRTLCLHEPLYMWNWFLFSFSLMHVFHFMCKFWTTY